MDNAARLARVAGRFGGLDERLRRGPEGWRHRLALRLSGVQDDTAALARVGWAVRRLTGGPGPEVDLAAFVDRRDPENMAAEAEPFADRAGGWLDLMAQAADLHPISRACMGFHIWSLAGLGQHGDRMEAAAMAVRIATSEGRGAIFAPLAMGGAGGLRAGGTAANRLMRWLDRMETASLTAMRHLDDIEAWSARSKIEMATHSGRTPPSLASRADRMASCLRPNGRRNDRRQSSGRLAELGLDGSPRFDPRSDWAGAVPHVVRTRSLICPREDQAANVIIPC